MRRAAARALIASVIALAALGCASSPCADGDCAQVSYRWPCPGCGRPILVGRNASALYVVGWSRAHNGGSFCPVAPRAVSSDETVLAAEFTAACGTALRVTGIAAGSAHIDLLDGDRVLGRWETGVAEIHHLAIVRSDASATTRQDPSSLPAIVGQPLELTAYAYDADGRSLFADTDTASWISEAPTVLSVDDPTAGIFSAHAAGSARVSVDLAGESATATVIVSTM
jgi:hypothetical protein